MNFYKPYVVLVFLFFHIPSVTFSQVRKKPSIAVFNFISNTGDDKRDARLSFGVTETVVTDLINVSALEVVERSRLKDINQEILYNQTGFVDNNFLISAGLQHGAQYILTGSWQYFQKKYRLNARIIETETTAGVAGIRIDGTDIFDMQDQIVAAILEKIKVSPTKIEASKIKGLGTKNIRAFDEYSLGLKADITDNKALVQYHMKNALKYDPNFEAPKKYIYRFGGSSYKANTLKGAKRQLFGHLFISCLALGGGLEALRKSETPDVPKGVFLVSGATLGLVLGLWATSERPDSVEEDNSIDSDDKSDNIDQILGLSKSTNTSSVNEDNYDVLKLLGVVSDEVKTEEIGPDAALKELGFIVKYFNIVNKIDNYILVEIEGGINFEINVVEIVRRKNFESEQKNPIIIGAAKYIRHKKNKYAFKIVKYNDKINIDDKIRIVYTNEN